MEEENLIRGEKRIIGGVCSALAKKYSFDSWILQIGLVLISVYFYYTIFIYLIMWVILPNEVKVDAKKQSRSQILGLIIGGILGALVSGGFTFLVAKINNEPGNGGIAPFLLALMGIPFGMVIGFSIPRYIAEKRALRKRNHF